MLVCRGEPGPCSVPGCHDHAVARPPPLTQAELAAGVRATVKAPAWLDGLVQYRGVQYSSSACLVVELHRIEPAKGRPKASCTFEAAREGLAFGYLPLFKPASQASTVETRVLRQYSSSRVLRRRTAPFPPFRIPSRVPHAF